LSPRNKAPRTVEGYLESSGHFDRWLDDRHSDLMPDGITAEVCRTWLLELGATRRPSTVKTRWGALRQFWAWCLDEGEIATNPMEKVKAPMVPDIPVELLTADQIKAVLSTCDGPSMLERRDQAILLLYLDTGGRLSAIATARLDGLDLRERTLRAQEKGRKEQLLPFGARDR
jgi:integrase/recombinase XerC